MGENNTTWVDVQKRAFTRWANGFLSERLLEIKVLEEDLSDGRNLINLLEIISSKPVGVPSKNPKTKFQKVENLNAALKFIASENIKLVGIGAEDIHDGKLKLILGLIWTLILRFHINLGEGSPKWELLQWVRQQVKPYQVDEPNNFTKDWMDGKILAALVDSIEPDIMTPKDMSGLTGDKNADVDKAMQIAKDSYGIPRILDVSDMTESPDELAMMTYVSYFREYLGEEARRRREEMARKLRTADPAFCFADGPGLSRADTFVPAEFCIHARNCFDKELDPKHGGDAFKVDIVGPKGATVAANVTDKGDGDYPVTYKATRPGGYSVTITLEGAGIKGSPYTLTVYGPSTTHTKVSGSGVEGSAVGVESNILIEAFDQDGKRVTSGGDKFEVKVSGPENLGSLPVKDLGNGTHAASYKASKPGHFTVEVLYGEDKEHVAKSPYDVLIENGNAGKSYAEGPGLHGGKTDHDLHFTIHSVDANGNPAKEGGDPFQVQISGPQAVPAQVQDHGDGTYGVTYNPEQPGDYTIAVTLHGKPIKDAPFRAVVKPGADAGKSWAEGPGLEGGQTEKPAEFTVHTVDKHGNPLTEGNNLDELKASITGPDGGEVPADVSDNGDGTYAVKYNPVAPGDYTVQVTLQDQPIKDMPKRVHIKASPDAAQSYAEGPGLIEAVDNEPAVFTVTLLDKTGTQRVDGGDDVAVNISGGPAAVTAKITDHGDGTYGVEYEATEPGTYTIDVLCEGQHVKDSPFSVPCKEGTDADNSGFGQFTFTIQSRDKRGNAKTFGGDKFEVEIKNKADPDALMESEAIDNGDGTYTAKYTLGGEGTFFIGVKLNGKSIKGSPFKQRL